MRLAFLKIPRGILMALQFAFFALPSFASAGAVTNPIEPQFELKSWDRRDELPAALISHVQRSANGYLWLTSEKGLVRFDGVRFHVIPVDPIPGLQSNKVTTLLADTNRDLWLGTAKGVFRCVDATMTDVQPVLNTPQTNVRALARDPTGSVWALSGTNDLTHIVNGKATPERRLPAGLYRTLTCDVEGSVLVSGPSDAYVITQTAVTKLPDGITRQLKPDITSASRTGGFWVSGGTTVGRLTETNKEFRLDWTDGSGAAPQTPISALVEDRAGRLWAGTRLGAIHCLIPGIGWREITPKRSRSLGGISCLYEDEEGLVWAGTIAGNLHQIKPRLFNLLSLPTITQDNVPQTVCVAHDGTVWVGTDGNGIYRFKDEVFTRIPIPSQSSNATVMAIFEDRDNQLWFGTLSGLFRLETNHLKPELESAIHSQPVPALFQDREGALWFGTVGAVIRKRGEEIKTYALGNPGHDKEVRAIAAGRNEIWVGTRSGGLFHIRKDKVEHANKFQRPAVESLYRDNDGALWIGSVARGLYRMKGGNLRYWSRTDGFPSDWVHSIVEDSNGILWLSSNDGVFGVAKSTLLASKHGGSPLSLIQVAASEVENWSVGSGQPSSAQSPDGRLWFPVGHGVLSFNPKELLRKRALLPVMIESVKVDDVERPFSSSKPLEIYTGMKRLEFRYTIADLDSPGRLKFRYQLEGQDERFIDGSAQRNATYGALGPGTYHFRVTCSGSANDMIETANPLTVIVKPHYYETRSFQASVGFLLLGLVATTAHFVGRAKLRRKLERLEMQQAMEKERRRIAQDLHDDLGSGITEIMLLSELAKTDGNVPHAEIRSQLNGITEKARQVATAMDEIVWTVNPKNDSLPDLASYLADHAREFLRSANVSCRIDMMENLPVITVTAQQRHNLFLSVKEALNNAIKHSGAKEVWLRITWRDNRLNVTVEDNGCGFTDEAERGNGLGNMLARMESIQGHAEIMTEPGKGSRISFVLPLVSQHAPAA